VTPSHPPRRLVVLSALAVLLGLAAGGTAWVLLRLIAVLTNVLLFHHWGTELPDFADLPIGPGVVVVAVAGAAAVTLLARWSPIIRGHGIPEAMDAVLTRRSRVSPRTAIAKPVSAAIAIGTGGPFGAEGPIIVTGGALGSLAGQLFHVSANERKILLGCGAAAGMAATFGTPLAAVVLVIELLLFEFSPRAFIPVVVATSVAAGVHAVLFGAGPLFTVPAHDFSGLGQLPLFAALGLLCGLLAVVISRGLFRIEDVFRSLPVGDAWHPVIGAVAFASLGLLVPRALGVGYDVIDDALAGRLAIGTLAALAIGKLVIWWIALASGTSGGTLAPILLISSSFGALIGEVVARAFPGLGLSPSAFALVAMAATFGAAARAPFAAIVFLFELTRDYNAILPLMLATVLADLLARALLPNSIMTEKLARRGVAVPSGFHADPLRTTPVHAEMTTTVVTVPADATLDDARRTCSETGHSAFPVVDSTGRLVGIVGRADLLGVDDGPSTGVTEVAVADVVTIDRDANLNDAVQRMIEEEVDHLPVVEGKRLVGMFTRADLLRARMRYLDHEQPEPGWLVRRKPRHAP
jgi:H+/Cl- antiporter ClcA/CBS domain-containing protein